MHGSLWHMGWHIWTCVCGSILLVQACTFMARVHMSCSLHSIKSKETRGVKMFPTKTSRDVGMVDCVSDATGSCMEKPAGGKSPGTRRCIPWHCTDLVNIRRLQDTYFGYTFTIPTSGNNLMQLGLMHQSAMCQVEHVIVQVDREQN